MYSPNTTREKLAAGSNLRHTLLMQREDLTRFGLPDSPGIYRFQKGERVLYVGKATSLRDRVRSYFSKDLVEARSPAIAGMVADADTLTWEETDSVLEALILEANEIKRLEPPFNIDQKDNKSFNYLVITDEAFPALLVVRGRELFTNWAGGKIKHLFGPFPQGGALREAMKLVRKILPYRDQKCTPCAFQRQGEKTRREKTRRRLVLKERDFKPCFNRQIGLCPGVCTGEMEEKEYAERVKHIVLLFSGKKQKLLKELERDMARAAKEERFEDATVLRRQVAALTHIRDVALIKDDVRFASGGAVRASGNRIEAYDVAHTAGTETVGVMVVVEDGEAQKSEYRKFKVNGFTNNDPGALSEILQRRLMHPEWPLPRLIIVDGSTAQMNAAKRVLEKAGVLIPLVGVVKDEFHRPERLTGDKKAIAECEKEILFANSEAHRFAINYHRTRRRRAMV